MLVDYHFDNEACRGAEIGAALFGYMLEINPARIRVGD